MVKKTIEIVTDNPEFNNALAEFVYCMVNKFRQVDYKHGDRSVVRPGYQIYKLDNLTDGIYTHLLAEVSELDKDMNVKPPDAVDVMGESVDIGNMAFLMFWKGMMS